MHHFQPASRSNGPGWRALVWFQGCTLGCAGCYNPQTHSAEGGETVDPVVLADQIIRLQPSIQGITISGGEPFQQLPALLALVTHIRQNSSLSILLFSGFDLTEIQKIPRANAVLAQIDVLIAGRYISSRRLAQGLLGSANKTAYYLTSRYSQADLDAVPVAEVIINPDGEIIFSGISPVQWGS